MTVSTCPTPAELEALVSGVLPEAQASGATEHIGSCRRCQVALESAAQAEGTRQGDSSLGQMAIEDLVGNQAAAVPSDSAYWEAVKNVSAGFQHADTPKVDLTETLPPDGTSGPAQSDAESTPTLESRIPAGLPFLKKSDDPAYIGRLHHFEISRVIGRGGMGIVLEAFDTHLQRNVAIKVLNPEYAKNDIARQRFCREGRAAAAISHEHVVAMHQVVREDEGKTAFSGHAND